ncbi:MAG: hypothetical protein ACFFDY_00340 [Candidatus Thorarchaeota archaeon]
MKSKKISLAKRKIKFWERRILSIDQRLERSKDGVEEINDIISNPPIIAGIRIKIDLDCLLSLSKKSEYLLKQYQIDYGKRQLFVQYRSKWKSKYLELIDPRTPEEIDKGWDSFWDQIKGKRKPEIKLDGFKGKL